MTTYTFDAIVATYTYDPNTDTDTFTSAEDQTIELVLPDSFTSFSYEVLSIDDSAYVYLDLATPYSLATDTFTLNSDELSDLEPYVVTIEWGNSNTTGLLLQNGEYENDSYSYSMVFIYLAGDEFPSVDNLSDGLDLYNAIDAITFDPPEGFQEGDDISVADIGGAISEVDNFSGSTSSDTVYLGAGKDTFKGLAGADNIYGGNGADTLSGDNGYDKVYGGSGADKLNGGNGNDTLNGGAGSDTLNGGNGADKLNGGNGNDTLNGGAGKDTLNGGSGADKLNGGNGNDTLNGGAGGDTLKGGSGADKLNGGNGTDTLKGGFGADTLNGGKGNDSLFGGAGEDTFFFNGTANMGQDTIQDWTDIDTIALSGLTAADVTVSSTSEDTYIDYGDANMIIVAGVSDALGVYDSLEFV